MSRTIDQPVSRPAFKSFFRFASFLSAGTALAVIASAVLATSAFSAFAEPPNRVGRVSLTEGNVSFYMDRNEGWKPARINYPVTSENSVWTGAASRAEVRIGSSALRLDNNSIVDFIRITDDQTQAYLQRGTINIRTRSDRDQNTFSVETGEGRFFIESNGRYAINASVDGQESRISVFSGRARFESAAGGGNRENVITVDRGRTLVVFGENAGYNSAGSNRGNTNFRFETAAESNFGRWADGRDRSWDQTYTRYASSQVISPYMTGYEDLDTYGDWIDNGDYGRIWAPRNVSSNWAPYRNGSWSYVNPWGWTWVDDAPWGFAPFHYGRWVTIDSRWCWWPGEYNRRPAYAPALVAWYGSPGLSVNVSIGSSVGWFPLAPSEYYVPSYTNNATYIRNVNYVTNNITVNNYNPPAVYQNQVPGATFVNQNIFAQSKPIAVNAIRATPSMMANYVPQQVVSVPRPVMQGEPVMSGAPMQSAKPGVPNSVSSAGRNNVVAPVYAGQPQGQGQGQGQGQSQGQPGQLSPAQAQNQIPGRGGSGAAIAGAAVAGAAVGAAAIVNNNNNNNAPQARGTVVGKPQNAFPSAVSPAPMVRGGANNATPAAVGGAVMNAPINNVGSPVQQSTNLPQPAPVTIPSRAAPRADGAPNSLSANTSVPPTVAPPQPAYTQGGKPNATGSVDLNAQPRVRQNRGAESGDVNANRRNKPQSEYEPQGLAPNQRQERQERAPARIQQPVEQPPQLQPQAQPQRQPQAQRAQQQGQAQVQPQQQQPQQRGEKQPHAEKPQQAEKQQNAPRVEGQGKPGQKD